MLKEYSFEKTAIQTFADNVPLALRTEDMQVFYGSNHAMHDASLSFPKNQFVESVERWYRVGNRENLVSRCGYQRT